MPEQVVGNSILYTHRSDFVLEAAGSIFSQKDLYELPN